MSIRTHVKRNAKNALSGKYAAGIAITALSLCIYLFLSLVEQVVYTFFGWNSVVAIQSDEGTAQLFVNTSTPVLVLTFGLILVYFLFTTPLVYGRKLWAYTTAEGNAATMATALYFFQKASYMGKTIYMRVRIGLVVLFWWIVCSAPAILSTWALFGVYDLGDGVINLFHLTLIFLTFALYLVGGAFTVFASAQYFLVPYLFYENVEMKVGEMIKTSRRYMKGYKTQIFTLHLSFIPFYMLNLLVMPIVFTTPYMEVTKGIFAKYYIERGRMEHSHVSHTMEIVL